MGLDFVLLGNMASGKTSISMILKNDLDYTVISARDVILESLASAPESVRKLRQQGYLLPDELVQKWIFARIEGETNMNRPMVLDGYPRTPFQAGALLARRPGAFKIIYPDFDLKILKKRFANRLLCDNCQMPFSKLFRDFNNQCFYCGSTDLNPRPTDKADYFKVKTGQFKTTTRKIIPMFQAQSMKFIPIQNHASFQALREEVLDLVRRERKNGN